MAKQENRGESRLLWRRAPLWVAAFSAVLPVVQVGLVAEGLRLSIDAGSYRDAVWAIVGTVLLLPLYTHHVYWAARGLIPRSGLWTLLVLTLVVAGTLPLAGALWLPTFHVVVVSALIVLRPPWSLVTAAGVLVALVPLGLALDDSGLVIWHPVAAIWRSSAVFALVWVVGALRRLQDAQSALAERAVERERVRMDGEVQRTMGTALETIAGQGRRARTLAERDRSAAEDELHGLVGGSRRTLADARQLIGGYYGSSLRTELDTAVSLLEAAGITARLDTPSALPETVDADARTQLRSATAELLTDRRTRSCVIVVTDEDGRVRVRLDPETSRAAHGGPVA